MITKTTKAHYKRVKSLQKLSFAATTTVFEGADGKYYECDQRSAYSLREIFTFQKELKKQLTAQTSMLE
jgi:hypothetical protein